jgi:16S rRNA (adenine1518-N6/adenine1519-N6)-dimethyltransferase
VWAEKLLLAIAPSPGQTFLEIGPGRGALTRMLARAADHVLAYEIDRDLVEFLRQTVEPNVHVIEGDFLEAVAGDIRRGLRSIEAEDAPLRVAGNLPYYVASPILFKLVELAEAGLPIVDATVMLQREVAARLVAEPGTREYGVLSALIGHSARAEPLLQLPAGAFRPAPKVLSTVVRLTFHKPDPPVRSPKVFAALTQAVFTRRRKTLRNAVLAYESAPPGLLVNALDASGIDPQRRPETLTIAELARLADRVSESMESS